MTHLLLDRHMDREYGARFVKGYDDADDPRCGVRVYATQHQRLVVETTTRGVHVYSFSGDTVLRAEGVGKIAV